MCRSPAARLAFRDTTKKKDVREANIEAAKAVADAVRTSLGPRGMNKMVRDEEAVRSGRGTLSCCDPG